jgi:hypothetical protein
MFLLVWSVPRSGDRLHGKPAERRLTALPSEANGEEPQISQMNLRFQLSNSKSAEICAICSSNLFRVSRVTILLGL